MITAQHKHQNGHSAKVRMTLHLNGHTLSIAQMGPDFVILRQPVEHPPADAEITFVVDEQEERWPVYLPDGIRGEQTKVAVSKL
jgi:hypothetical protein